MKGILQTHFQKLSGTHSYFERLLSAMQEKKEAPNEEKFDPLILFNSKRDVAELLGEETKVQSIRKYLQKKQKR